MKSQLILGPLPRIIKMNIDEIRAVEIAVDSLPYGKFNKLAAAVEEKALAEYKRRKDQGEKFNPGLYYPEVLGFPVPESYGKKLRRMKEEEKISKTKG
jgi:hypothetical protein